MSETGWQRQAACATADPELFHPGRGRGYTEAKRYCDACPVADDCLRYALDHMTSEKDDPEDIGFGRHGMWGGTIPEERWAILGKAWAIA